MRTIKFCDRKFAMWTNSVTIVRKKPVHRVPLVFTKHTAPDNWSKIPILHNKRPPTVMHRIFVWLGWLISHCPTVGNDTSASMLKITKR